MFDILKENLLGPLVRRIGTALSGFLAAQGVGEEPTAQILIGLSAAVFVVIDLALERVARR